MVKIGGQNMNDLISKMIGSASLELVQKAKKLKEEGKTIYDLSVGEPDFDTPDRIKKAAIEAIEAGDTHYIGGRGIPELLDRIVKKAKEENDISCTVDNVIVTPGAKYAIYMIVASMINPGDEVMIFAPYWFSYAPIIEACGGVPVVVELFAEQDFRLNKQDILNKITDKTKLMLINYPNNPTGNILLRSEADMLVEIIKEKKIHVVSDEIYEKLIFDGKEHISLGAYKEIADYVITVNGLSKSVAMTGWRVGYIIAHPDIIKVMSKMYAHTITCLSGFVQKAAVVAFDCDDEVEEMRKIYQERRNYMLQQIAQIPGLTCDKIEGTFYLWVHIECPWTTEELCSKLMDDYGVVAVPGEPSGVSRKGYIRMSFAKDMETLQGAVEALARFGESLV